MESNNVARSNFTKTGAAGTNNLPYDGKSAYQTEVFGTATVRIRIRANEPRIGSRIYNEPGCILIYTRNDLNAWRRLDYDLKFVIVHVQLALLQSPEVLWNRLLIDIL